MSPAYQEDTSKVRLPPMLTWMHMKDDYDTRPKPVGLIPAEESRKRALGTPRRAMTRLGLDDDAVELLAISA